MSEILEKALLLKQLYLRKLCGESYCQNIDFSPKKPLVSDKSKMTLEQIIENCVLCELSKSANGKSIGQIRADSQICFITLKPIAPYSASFEMIENIAKRVFGVESYSLLSLIKCDTHIQSNATHAKICLEYLQTQLAKLKNTKLFVLFGEEVARFVLHSDESLEHLRGRILNNTNKRDFIVTFHVGDLLKNQSLKKLAFSDFQVAKDYLSKKLGEK